MPLEHISIEDISTANGQIDLFLHSFAENTSDILSLDLSDIGYNYDDFFIEIDMIGGIFTGKQIVMDKEKFLQIPLQTARIFYEEFLYREYVVKSGWFSCKNKDRPICDICSKQIKECKDMRRFYGRSIHSGDCARTHFSGMHFNESNSWDKRVFERMSSF